MRTVLEVRSADEKLKSKEEPDAENQTPGSEKMAAVKIHSEPNGGEIYVDDSFVGNAPAELRIAAWKHKIRVAMKGRQDWEKVVNILPDSEISLNVSLDLIQ